ncbi:hypothetical protein PBI_PHANTASTIC_8 [Mycobacterium phage Phantastic]|uniref:Uncharacterized protein n=1 Tax=Mycobacterium phage Phantastic TaxID=1486426 RepID=A0A023W667_9CAUD|nr:hypothetical protein FH39_gp91 [Mycobacterium phage Phantastic]AHY27071.1 hypothetical protein PBI_PHANTASTIC_8 [Mycobacterium phage Phantastic]
MTSYTERTPMILKLIGDEIAKTLIPRVIDAVATEIEKHIPALTEALVTAVTEAMVRRADDVTDAIPGDLDDRIIDPIVRRALDIFRGRSR